MENGILFQDDSRKSKGEFLVERAIVINDFSDIEFKLIDLYHGNCGLIFFLSSNYMYGYLFTHRYI